MSIQEVSPLPADPLADLDDDYHHAVLHIAWDLHTDTKERALLFAFVELLPAEIPPPKDDYDARAPRCRHRLGGDSKHHVYVRHAVTTARRALEWYRACRIGQAVLPENDGAIPEAEHAGTKRLKLAEMGEEPLWPTLVSASEDSDTLPFMPQWINCPRTHHLLPLADFDLNALWSDDEQKEARVWLEGRLHFKIGDYREYWGSVHLIAPNPIYREFDVRLQPRVPPMESVLLEFQPRMGKSLEGLEVDFREKDPWGVTASERAKVQSPLLRVNLSREVNAVMEDVWDPRRGFLQLGSEAHTFIQSVQFGLGFVQRTIIDASGDAYEVMRSGAPEMSVVGAPHKVAPARMRMVVAHEAREKRRVAGAHDQRWFREQKEDARDLLRSLLNEANREVLVIDPYFGAKELIGFTLAVGRHDIPIRILSSAEVLKEDATKGSEIEKGDQLLDALRQLKGHERMNPFEIRVMPGERPAIHDRFLAIDNCIWLLGSSLNEFGARGTMMLALPDPDAVRSDLAKAWDESEDLDVWVEQRKKNRDKAQEVSA